MSLEGRNLFKKCFTRASSIKSKDNSGKPLISNYPIKQISYKYESKVDNKLKNLYKFYKNEKTTEKVILTKDNKVK